LKVSEQNLEPAPWPAGGLERAQCCPLCGARERKPLHLGIVDHAYEHTPGRWDLHRCAKCACAYLDPRPTRETIHLAYRDYYTHLASAAEGAASLTGVRRARRALANGYRNRRYGTHEQPAHVLGVPAAWLFAGTRHRIDLEFRHLPRPLPGARLLDVGFGDGTFLERAKSAGWQVTGIDPDPVTVEAARKRGLDVRQGSLDAPGGVAGPFDVVTLSHVIEHVHDPRALVREVHKLLKPGGLVWIETPNLASSGHQRFGAAWRGLEPPRHLVLFDWDSLEALLRAEGFGDIRRLPRHEVYAEQAPKSLAIRRGWHPRTRPAPGLGERVAHRWLGLGSRLDYRRTEYVTLLARAPR